MKRGAIISVLALLASISGPSCASKPASERSISRLIPQTLRVRRPEGPGADPQAGPGGEDYLSRPLPNERLDCEKIAGLYRGMDLQPVRACLQSVQKPYIASYRLRREAVPFLELEVDEKTTPPCLREKLPRIPVPREILYQSTDEGELGCYSTRLDIEADEIFKVKLPKDKVALTLSLPLRSVPAEDKGLIELMGTWSLAPLWNPDGHRLTARVVPSVICRQCLGEKEMLRKLDPDAPPVLWP
jgi:hypothetical protein